MTSVPFLDLRAQLKDIREEVLSEVQDTIGRCDFILGDKVRLFEEEFARFCGTQHSVGVASGLDALRLALRAIGVGKGDEVIIPANTFIATALAVTSVG